MRISSFWPQPSSWDMDFCPQFRRQGRQKCTQIVFTIAERWNILSRAFRRRSDCRAFAYLLMNTQLIPPDGRFDASSKAVTRRDSAARAAEEASFSQLYDEALALGGEGSVSETAGEESSDDLLSGCEALVSRLGAGAVPPGAAGEIPSAQPHRDNSSAVGARPALADAAAAKPGVERINDAPREASRVPSVSAASGSPAPATSPEHRGGFSKNRLIEWMDKHAHLRSLHLCAMFFRRGMEAAGASTADRPVSGDAADYGPYLLGHGAKEVATESYQPQAGDTAVFGRSELHPAGHIEIFDGERWVSDFVQRGFSPYRDAGSTPSFKIYRLS